jgi:hypothetical protein
MSLRENELTDTELALIETLPSPPAIAEIQTTNIWIIEWLSPGEAHTGRQLHEWMEDQRPGWSTYHYCATKAQVIQAIQRATTCAQASEMIPVLHLEAHGSNAGLASDNSAHAEFLTWEELIIPLQ